ncbi:MAG TPA: GxxExxY protein [Gemmatimonadaceae bacterium]|nr:GxxExxY protein [Gemmatimonadaceae bacterium]
MRDLRAAAVASYGDEFTHRVLGCGIKVHRVLRVGLLEHAYETCFYRELVKAGFSVERQKSMPIVYEGEPIDQAYVPDLIVDGRLIIEVKAAKELIPIYDAQILTYLKFSGISLGFLMNFHADPLMRGVKRFVWKHPNRRDP